MLEEWDAVVAVVVGVAGVAFDFVDAHIGDFQGRAETDMSSLNEILPALMDRSGIRLIRFWSAFRCKS